MTPRYAALVLVPLLVGCAASRSEVFGPVAAGVERRVGVRPRLTDARSAAAVATLLRRPLDRDAVVRIALANSARAQASFESLGIAAAAVADATVLGPTEVEAAWELGPDGDRSSLEVDVLQDVLGLIQIGQRRGIASAGLRARRARVIAETVELVARAEIAYVDMVAAEQELELEQTAFDAFAAAADITERQHAAGNVNDLELARQQSAREQARLDLARAQERVELRREALNRVLGLTGASTRWIVAGRLEEAPAAAPEVDQLERESVAANLELAAVREDAIAAAGRVGHARLRTFLPELAVGMAASRQEDGSWEAGPAVQIGLPLFGWNSGARARAHAELRQAGSALTATAVELRADARATRQELLSAHAEVRHLRTVVLPLAERVLAESVLQYNAMNVSTFELLQARRDQVASARRYVDALRRYWSATAKVAALRRGGGAALADEEPDSREAPGAASAGGDHG